MFSYKCWIEGVTTLLSWLAMLTQAVMQQTSIVATDNEASDKDSNETETLGACVVLITEGGIWIPVLTKFPTTINYIAWPRMWQILKHGSQLASPE